MVQRNRHANCKTMMNKLTIPAVLPFLKAYASKEGNGAGGSLHTVFDGNVADKFVESCIEWAKERGDDDGVKLGMMLLRMSRTQRLKLGDIFYHLPSEVPR